MTQRVETGPPATGAQNKVSNRLVDIGCILLFAAISAYVFRDAWKPLMTIAGADASLWVPHFVQQWTKWLFIPRWFPHFLAGIGQQFQFLSHGIILMLLAPPHKFHVLEFMLDTFLAGTLMFLFLRDRGLGRFGSLIGGISYQLGNGLLTGASQGALWKFDTVCWVPLFLLFFSRVLAGNERRLRNAFFAGISLGLQFLGGEVQLAYYVCLLALALFVVDSIQKLWVQREHSLQELGKRIGASGLVVAVAIIFSAEVFVSYITFIRNNENVGAATEADNWKFATEFSFPPEETLSLIFTGDIFPDGSRITSNGAPIHRITDDYLGVLVLLFALLGLLSDRRYRYFFAFTACVSLLISFGKFFPLPYRLIYSLPLMNGMRNPHKWLFITGLCTAILAGFGADYWFAAPAHKNRKITITILAFALLAAAAAFLAPAAARAALRGNVVSPAFFRPLCVLASGAVLLLFTRTKKMEEAGIWRAITAGLLMLLLAGDLIFNASKYLVYYNYRQKYVENEVAQFLRGRPGPFRVKLWAENEYLRETVTEVLPYYGIDTVDAIMSRRPERYSKIFQALRDQRLPLNKFLQLFNVRYALSASPIKTTDVPLTLVQVFHPQFNGTPLAIYLYEFSDFLPRVYAVEHFRSAASEKVLELIGNESLDLAHSVALEKTTPETANVEHVGEFVWKVKKYEESPHHVNIEVSMNRPGFLVLLSAADDYWRVRVDQRENELLRADYLMRAVELTEGSHHVEFIYRPPIWGFIFTAGAWALLLTIMLAGAGLAWRKQLKQKAEGEA